MTGFQQYGYTANPSGTGNYSSNPGGRMDWSGVLGSALSNADDIILATKGIPNQPTFVQPTPFAAASRISPLVLLGIVGALVLILFLLFKK